MKPAYNFPYLLGIAAGENPVKLGFASETQARRYRFSFYNWRRGARKRGEEVFESVGIYQRPGPAETPFLIIFATRHNAALVPELAASFPEPLSINISRSEEDDFLMGISNPRPADIGADLVLPSNSWDEEPSPPPPPGELPEY